MPKFSSTNNPYYVNSKQELKKDEDHQDALSQKSGSSNRSAREILFQRSNMDLVESRLSNKNASRSRLRQNNSLSRISTNSQKYRIRRSQKNAETQIRSVSSSKKQLRQMSNSRNKLLNEIADKLKNREKADDMLENKYYNDNREQIKYSRSYSVRNKESKETPGNIRNKAVKTKLSKLENLLKEIKKSNKEAVYITKRQHPQFIDEQEAVNYKQVRATYNQKRPQIEQLAEQLKLVKKELKEVKEKNDELVNLSQSRSNLDSVSLSSHNSKGFYYSNQESRRIEMPNSYSYNIYSQNPNVMKKDNKNPYILIQKDYIQPCFACGCTCKSKPIIPTNND